MGGCMSRRKKSNSKECEAPEKTTKPTPVKKLQNTEPQKRLTSSSTQQSGNNVAEKESSNRKPISVKDTSSIAANNHEKKASIVNEEPKGIQRSPHTEHSIKAFGRVETQSPKSPQEVESSRVFDQAAILQPSQATKKKEPPFVEAPSKSKAPKLLPPPSSRASSKASGSVEKIFDMVVEGKESIDEDSNQQLDKRISARSDPDCVKVLPIPAPNVSPPLKPSNLLPQSQKSFNEPPIHLIHEDNEKLSEHKNDPTPSPSALLPIMASPPIDPAIITPQNMLTEKSEAAIILPDNSGMDLDIDNFRRKKRRNAPEEHTLYEISNEIPDQSFSLLFSDTMNE